MTDTEAALYNLFGIRTPAEVAELHRTIRNATVGPVVAWATVDTEGTVVETYRAKLGAEWHARVHNDRRVRDHLPYAIRPLTFAGES